jgi:hypothetical protein
MVQNDIRKAKELFWEFEALLSELRDMLFSEEEWDKIWNMEREFFKEFEQNEARLGLTSIDYSYMIEEKRAKLYFPIIAQLQDSEKLLCLHNCATKAFNCINQVSKFGL